MQARSKPSVAELRFDSIVVGSGPGGCVAAARLADAGHHVALLEAGPALPLPDGLRSLGAVGSETNNSHSWAELVAGYSGRSVLPIFPYRQGRALGGSSAINSMVLSPGDERDYLQWETTHGCVGWGPESMRPWLDRAIASLPVQVAKPGPLTSTVMDTLSVEVLNRSANRDSTWLERTSLDLNATGVVDAALAARSGQRCTTFDALISDRDASAGRQIDVHPRTSVTRVLIDKGRAVGVETTDGQTLRADRTILAAGAVGTPKILTQSVDHHGPIGSSIVDHPSFAFAISSSNLWGENSREVSDDRSAGNRVASAQPDAISKVLRFAPSKDDLDPADIQVLVIENLPSGSQASNVDQTSLQGLSVVIVALVAVSSFGRMQFGADGAVQINRGCLTTSEDRRRFRQGTRQVAEVLVGLSSDGSIADVTIDDQGTPAATMLTMADDELDQWLADHPGPVAHLAGACRMGPSPDGGAVVSCLPESAGQVFGLSGLYVTDSSALPNLTSGGLQIPVMAVSDRIVSTLLD